MFTLKNEDQAMAESFIVVPNKNEKHAHLHEKIEKIQSLLVASYVVMMMTSLFYVVAEVMTAVVVVVLVVVAY